MKKINRSVFYILFVFLLYSCGAMSDAGKVLRNEKVKTTDEFLVKKRQPLALPPDYETLPKPGSLESSQKDKIKEIDKIFKISKETSPSKSSKSVEQSILNKIGK